MLQEKKRLEEALLELERVNGALLNAAQDSESGKGEAAVYSISADSAQLLGELRSRPRSSYCPVSGLERSAVPLLPHPAPETCTLQVRTLAAMLPALPAVQMTHHCPRGDGDSCRISILAGLGRVVA